MHDSSLSLMYCACIIANWCGLNPLMRIKAPEPACYNKIHKIFYVSVLKPLGNGSA